MDHAENIHRIRDFIFLIPSEKFDQIVQDKGYSTSLIYLAACVLLSLPIEFIINTIIEGPLQAAIGAVVGTLIFFPVAYVMYAIQHLLLKLVGGQGTLLQSVQVFIYGSTASLIFGSIPCINLVLSLVCLANVVLGSARVHRISVLRAAIALIVIPIALLVLAAVAFVLFFSAVPELSAPLLRGF